MSCSYIAHKLGTGFTFIKLLKAKKKKKKKKEDYVIDDMQAGKPKLFTVLPRPLQRKFADFLSKAENSHC